MNRHKEKKVKLRKRHHRLRSKLRGTAERPRLSVYRSLNHMYAQVIDDLTGTTLASASTRDKDLKVDGTTGNASAAAAVGAKIAENAKAKGISAVTFDRGGFKYHGRVKALADAAREGGLEF